MIRISSLSKKFGRLTAIDELTLNIPDGCIYGLIGSNGSGKSTLLRMLAGIWKQDAGSIGYDGKPVFENPEVKASIAYISDDPYTERSASISEMAGDLSLVYPHYDVPMALKLAESSGLDPKRQFKTFSKGMLRQSYIILALAAHPKYLLCDETFDGLDPVKRKAVRKLLADAVAAQGTTVIIASHNLRELEDICDHVVLLHQGQQLISRNLDDMSTNIFKLQAAFEEPRHKKDFEAYKPVSFSHRGRMVSMVVRGTREDIEAGVRAMEPLYFDLLPLTLEEVFIAEMEVRGYDADDILF